MRVSRAFTLLELLIVLLIIGILIAIGLYRYQSVVEASADKKIQANVRAVFIGANANKVGTSNYGNQNALVLALNGDDGISVTGFDGNANNAPTASVGVHVPNADEILVAQKNPNGNNIYCMHDDGEKIISGKLVGTTCSGSTTTAPVTNELSYFQWGEIRVTGTGLMNAATFEVIDHEDQSWGESPIAGDPCIRQSETEVAILDCWGIYYSPFIKRVILRDNAAEIVYDSGITSLTIESPPITVSGFSYPAADHFRVEGTYLEYAGMVNIKNSGGAVIHQILRSQDGTGGVNWSDTVVEDTAGAVAGGVSIEIWDTNGNRRFYP